MSFPLEFMKKNFWEKQVRWSILPLVSYLIEKIFSRNPTELVSLRQNWTIQSTRYQHIPGNNKLSDLKNVKKNIYS